MSDKPTQPPLNISAHTNHTEEEDLWDLEGIEDASGEMPPQQREEVAPAPTPPPRKKTPRKKESSNDPPPSQKKDNRLSILEKITLAGLCTLFLGLAVFSYVWLYKKNQTVDPFTVELPFQGKYITISEFSSYWQASHKSYEVKTGAQVIPSAQLTLKSDNAQSGALRIYFRNRDNETIGDPVTLTVKSGAFINQHSSNITISDDGLSAEITSSDGFHQEGDFSAYVLDPKLAWSIQIFEAASADAKWNEFKAIAAPKIKPFRK